MCINTALKRVSLAIREKVKKCGEKIKSTFWLRKCLQNTTNTNIDSYPQIIKHQKYFIDFVTIFLLSIFLKDTTCKMILFVENIM